MDKQLDLLFNSKAQLAEGPLWHPIEDKLYWVDIKNNELHRYCLIEGEDLKMTFPQNITATIPTNNGNLLAGMENCIAEINTSKKEYTSFVPIETEKKNTRCNDGKCGPDGRVWMGTMDKQAREYKGGLYSIESSQTITCVLKDLTIPNGITWSPDGKTMYFIDSSTYSVQAFDYDLTLGSISNRREVISISPEMGLPDGMTIDQEGMVWVALWGGGCVGRWDPRSGQLLEKIKLPAPNITCCTFGGNNYDKLFITTARDDLSEKELREYPLSGSIFMAKMNIQGFPACIFEY